MNADDSQDIAGQLTAGLKSGGQAAVQLIAKDISGAADVG